MGWGDILAQGVAGWQQGTDYKETRERRQKDDAYRDEARDRQRKDWNEADGLKADLKAAAMPVAVVEGANNALMPPTMDARDIGQPGEAPIAAGMPFRVGEQSFADSGAANAAASMMNAPDAVAGRQAQAYQRRGMPTEATALESKQAALQKAALDLKKNGVMEGVNALRQGNKDQAVKALKGSGMFNIDGDVTMVPGETEIPGVGKIKTYDLNFNTKNPDGTVSPMSLNSHTLAMGMMPYEKALDLMRKGSDSAVKADLGAQKLDLAAQRVEIAGRLAEMRMERARAGGGGGGEKADREYRLTLQNMTGNVSREIREIDESIKTLQKDAIPGRAPSPQLVELGKQRSALTQQRSALNDEFVGLAEKKAGVGNENIAAQRSLRPPKPVTTKYGDAVQIKSKEEYEKLPSGALYIPPGATPDQAKRKK